ncbi:hypothetical protein [Cyanobacterium sp. Dongsha4]|uniref:hypothetical protein n=1 Tax=Cyanobacterium sp. DS4 TaxID=2878255 RepID=UPI002E8227C6|nr:hypothetical protein [Cyanobacterium sp. Dongsha4]WVL00771.1 hypothetical protein Dongsha4_00810 [Cyanobacterium sp. Dongsha4]
MLTITLTWLLCLVRDEYELKIYTYQPKYKEKSDDCEDFIATITFYLSLDTLFTIPEIA